MDKTDSDPKEMDSTRNLPIIRSILLRIRYQFSCAEKIWQRISGTDETDYDRGEIETIEKKWMIRSIRSNNPMTGF
jgi:hypothetical protein